MQCNECNAMQCNAMQHNTIQYTIIERRPVTNVMAALSTIGCALCSTPQSLADARYQSAVQ